MPRFFRREPASENLDQDAEAPHPYAPPEWWDEARRWDDHRTLAALAEWMHEHEWSFSEILDMLKEPWEYDDVYASWRLNQEDRPE
jgi:hypothetical protein